MLISSRLLTEPCHCHRSSRTLVGRRPGHPELSHEFWEAVEVLIEYVDDGCRDDNGFSDLGIITSRVSRSYCNLFTVLRHVRNQVTDIDFGPQ